MQDLTRHHARHHRRQRQRRPEVRVVQHDVRRFAAQLQQGLLHRGGAGGQDGPPGGGRAGEGDHVDAWVGRQRSADLVGIRGHHVEDPGGNVGLLGDDTTQFGTRPRCELRRLEDHGVAGHQRRDGLGDVEVEGDVPRGDRAHDTDGLVVQFSAGRSEVGLVDAGVDQVVEVATVLGPVLDFGDRLLDLAAGHADRAPDLGHQHAAQPFLVPVQRVVQLHQTVEAELDVPGPVRVLECPPRRADRTLHVDDRGIGCLTRRRAHCRDVRRRTGRRRR